MLVNCLIRHCVIFVRQRAKVVQQLMGSLPDFRTVNCRPFTHSGVDYAGPFQIRFAPGRGQRSYKGYVALFVCCVTRAIHLELVSDYTSQSFLLAYKRFIARRRIPAHIYSDNGTTFQGADRILRENAAQLRRDPNLVNFLSVEGTTWHFIPPAASNFGGPWEAGVKHLKHHLRRGVGSHTLTFEEFFTTLSQVEACLSSRPIGTHSEDPNYSSYITPGHF
ncbi:uncharacterized protein LOC117175512 [Belonocnema kinseyi]|uniref:uncharacterized protein LOC117175512 n=1 Tax=Belonocnema kinseyi TaxID=2817044 RepID=UPI00143CC306|nr:uncharacterized protein LOC117175512 [Belonocnema kinseyi]